MSNSFGAYGHIYVFMFYAGQTILYIMIQSILSFVCVFFNVFEMVSWWSFRVSTPFSLLCLILLTHFH